MAREQLKESKMISYLIKSKIVDYIPEMISSYEEEHKIRFDSNTINELIAEGEEIVNNNFPSTSYNFTLQKKELKIFDEFISEFVQSFMNMLICVMRANMHLAQISLKIDALPDDE